MVEHTKGSGQWPIERDLYPVPEARERLGGISNGLFYSLVKAGTISITKLGRRSFVTAAELRRAAAERGHR